MRTIGQRDIVRRQIPAVFTVKKLSQSRNQRRISLRIGIIADILNSVFRRQLGKHIGEHRIDFSNLRRIAAAKHIDGLVAFERVAQIVHQLQNTAVLCEFFAEC
ncbi:Uncharacterised protein [Mycobacteroides abscessus subsp. massiliense]|nr:Uncharacterised protein [Mycobacteroides abscessus subsp. massiliense]